MGAEESRSRFVIHIRVSEDKAIKSPRASGCGAVSPPGLPRRIKLTDPPGAHKETSGHVETDDRWRRTEGSWAGRDEVVGSNERKILYFL